MATYEFQTLKITANGQNVENHFLKQKENAPNLVILFPGAGYTTMGPMLYYTANVAVERGDDVLLVEYGALLKNGVSLGDIAENAVSTALQQRSYDRLALVGKSMGTRALAHLSKTIKEWNSDNKIVRSVWLTPLLNDASLVSEIGNLGEAQFVATGTHDHPYYQASSLEHLPTTVETLVIPGADHGLDIPGDVLASVRTMEELIRRIADFIY